MTVLFISVIRTSMSERSKGLFLCITDETRHIYKDCIFSVLKEQLKVLHMLLLILIKINVEPGVLGNRIAQSLN